MNKAHILVVDDDDRLRALLGKFLAEQGFLVTTVPSAQEARNKMAWFLFDVLVLDVMMPGETGLDLLASLKSTPRRPPVIMLSAMGEAHDRIRGLETGADDYLPKPFEPKELVLRLQTVLRRQAANKEAAGVVKFGAYHFDTEVGQLLHADAPVYLTSGELAMLRLLAENAGNPVTREKLAAVIPGVTSERSVDVQITRLRKKIEESEGKPVYLQTVRGAGYVLYASPVQKLRGAS